MKDAARKFEIFEKQQNPNIREQANDQNEPLPRLKCIHFEQKPAQISYDCYGQKYNHVLQIPTYVKQITGS